jgi:hypothetical protein
MTEIHTLSFRAQLKGEIGDFIEKSGMACIETTKAMMELIVELSHYEEEGTALYPRVLVCDSLSETLGLLGGTTPIEIGKGPRIASTVKQALKKCAPLARQGWSIYVERFDDKFIYGVFREPELPTAIDVRATLASLPKDSVNAVLACQIAERAVEIVSTADRHLHIHLSAVSTDESPVNASICALIQAVVHDVPDEARESLRSYLSSTIGDALLHGHGTLIIVIKAGHEIPPVFADDGVVLPEPIELADIVKRYLEKQSIETILALMSYAELLKGMLGCDGITVLSSDGAIIGYNFFVKENYTAGVPASELIGGARHRAFAALSETVQAGKATCAFIRSSNGSSNHKVGVLI